MLSPGWHSQPAPWAAQQGTSICRRRKRNIQFVWSPLLFTSSSGAAALTYSWLLQQLQKGACRDNSKGKAKTLGHPGSRLPGELVQRVGPAQKMCNWPSWAITCCKWRQKDSFDTTVKITLLEKKKSIQTPRKENQKPRPSIPEIKSWKSQREDSQICTEKQNFTSFADKLLFMLKDKGAMRMQASMYSWKSNPWQKTE